MCYFKRASDSHGECLVESYSYLRRHPSVVDHLCPQTQVEHMYCRWRGVMWSHHLVHTVCVQIFRPLITFCRQAVRVWLQWNRGRVLSPGRTVPLQDQRGGTELWQVSEQFQKRCRSLSCKVSFLCCGSSDSKYDCYHAATIRPCLCFALFPSCSPGMRDQTKINLLWR